MTASLIQTAQSRPQYCEYVHGPCPEDFHPPGERERVFFAYGANPPIIAESITMAIAQLRVADPEWDWVSWEDLRIAGQQIFCTICKQIRASNVVVADITTLNFNLMFEIGWAISLRIPVVLIRDSTYAIDREHFKRLGLLDTLGYIDFRNATDLVEKLPDAIRNADEIGDIPQRAYRESPLYVVRPSIQTNGSLATESTLKSSRLRYRTYDSEQSVRLTINDARRQVNGSIAVVGSLLDNNREGARVNNALTAFLAGYASAREKIVLLLQEDSSDAQPIDYRDIVIPFETSSKIPSLMKLTLDRIYGVLQSSQFESPEVAQLGVLNELDLGDVAAENEISGLHHYFVPTGQSITARQGHARIVTGRKGSGKSAIFYEVRNNGRRGIDDVVLDLRPEGHQLMRLREFVDGKLSTGLQEYVLTGFWTYVLHTEAARQLIEDDSAVSRNDPARLEQLTALEDAYAPHDPGEAIDFPQRLVHYVGRITKGGIDSQDGAALSEAIMQDIYDGEFRKLSQAVVEYFNHKDSVWLLVDNLDKSWPIGGSTAIDVLTIRGLLEASRKLHQMLDDRRTEFKSLIFLRSDIYEHLVRATPDKGKDTAILLSWDDPVFFERIVERRILASTSLSGDFRDSLWPSICSPLIGTAESFAYMIDRTLMRPRDMLLFLHRCVETAINRGHSRIEEEDIIYAERLYSTDMLRNLQSEIVDLRREYGSILDAFSSAPSEIQPEEVPIYLNVYGGIAAGEPAEEATRALVEYGFLGVRGGAFRETAYSFAYGIDTERLWVPIANDDGVFVVHPAFRAALDIEC